jgi:threonylcarbamoyladenosine tRNA methylthiotransferase MtaB
VLRPEGLDGDFLSNERSSLEDAPVTRIAYTTFGCRLNQYDTEAIRTIIARERGYETVDQREPADIYVLNTCSVTARADANARKAIRRLHSVHPEARIVVTGCYAQRAPDELSALPGVALVIGAAERARIGEELQGIVCGGRRIRVSPIAEARSFVDIPIGEMTARSRAVVKIQDGCNRRCTFCIIPKTRGRSRSRRPERVLDEVQGLVKRGYQEIVLTAVHLGDYGLDLGRHERLLSRLLRDILDIPGTFRLRLSSIEPSSVNGELIELLASEQRLAPHLHIPVQSAADAVLKRMGRGYTADEFATLVNRVVRHIPDCGIGTDVICGFPGESEADFRQTFERLSALPITYIHPFPYSLRPGSEAEPYGDDIAPGEKKRRTRALKRLSRSKNQTFRETQLGKVVGVLFESRKGKANGNPTGWSDNYLRVRLCGESVSAGIRQVQIQDLTEDGLLGELVGATT